MQHIIIGTAGHVDHGKTALIKALTEIDCDTHKEEKDRGITINLGFAHLSLPSGESVGIVDMPGHKDFIKTMVAGAFGVDVVLLVIAADSGIMPQTIEHFKIIELLGIEHGIIVITKTDLVDSETLELAEMEIEEFTQGTVFENAPIIKVSSVNGNGLVNLTSEITKLLPGVKEKSRNKVFRMYIDRVFNVKGIGFIVTGSVLGGVLKVGNNLHLLPGKGKQYKVRSIQRHGETVDQVEAGDRAALNISGFKKEDFERGMILIDKLIDETKLIDATFQSFVTETDLGLWTNTIFFSGTFECAARVHLLNTEPCSKENPAIVQIHLDKPAVFLNNDKYIIRNSSNNLTIGGGVIIDTHPLHHRRRTTKLLESLGDLVEATLLSDNTFNLLKIELRKIESPIFINQIADDLGLSPNEILDECINNNDGSIIITDHPDKKILVHRTFNNEVIEKIISNLKAFHKQNYLIEEGIETNELFSKLGFKSKEAGKTYLLSLLKIMNKQGQLKRVNLTWALSSHIVNIDEKSLKQLSWLESTIKNYGHQTPVLKDIELQAQKRNINKELLKQLIKNLLKRKIIIGSGGEYVHNEIFNEVREKILLVLLEKERGINEKDFRVIIGCTKNFVKTMIRIFVNEELVTKSEFYIHITEKGKSLVSE